MDCCEDNDVRSVFGLSPNTILHELVFAKADAVCVRRAIGNLDVVRDCTETVYGAKSWACQRRVAARIEATRKGLDVRYVVTNIMHCGPAWLYDSIYCARGQAENSRLRRGRF
jgi:Transposase DDE domain group 1